MELVASVRASVLVLWVLLPWKPLHGPKTTIGARAAIVLIRTMMIVAPMDPVTVTVTVVMAIIAIVTPATVVPALIPVQRP